MSLRLRLISAIVFAPFVLAPVYFGGLTFFAFVCAALALATWEFCAMAQSAGNKPQTPFGIALVALLALNAYTHANAFREIIIATLLLSLVAAIFRHGAGWLTGWGLTLAGALYVGGLGAYLIALRELPNGLQWTILTLFCTWATDTFAFLAGMLFGRTPFFRHISPKKTWEGALGGFLGAILAALVLGTLYELDPFFSVAFGASIGTASMLGDLAESLIKRQMGAKDSGVIVPGHGGALDRLDSLLFSFAAAYYWVAWLDGSLVR